MVVGGGITPTSIVGAYRRGDLLERRGRDKRAYHIFTHRPSGA